eukprot:2852551-Alexandrium_andersonii.AAC.1
MEWWAPQWNRRLMILVYLGLSLGFVSDGNRELILKGIGHDCSASVQNLNSEGTVKEPMQKSAADVAKLRDRCVNALHVAMLVHTEERYIHIARMILFASKSLKKWYSAGTHNVRGREASREFFISMVEGSGCLESLAEVMTPFRDFQQLQQVGFVVDALPSEARFKTMRLGDPLVQEQTDLALQLMKICLHM